jgi:PBP1b-binding outer membrane lipoprotein LpoB
MKRVIALLVLTITLTGCVPGTSYNPSASSSVRNPMEDPQVKTLFR